MKTPNLYILYIFLSSFCAYSQSPKAIPHACRTCVDSLIKVFQFPHRTGVLESGDTLVYNYSFEKKVTEEGLIFIGDPDYSKIIHTYNGKTNIYTAGRYAPKSKLTQDERVFVPIKFEKGQHQLKILSNSIFHTYHYTVPHWVLGVQLSYIKSFFYNNNFRSRTISLCMIVLFGFISIYSIFNFWITKSKDYKYYTVYSFSIFIMLFFMLDWYSQWHIIFPKHPYRYLYFSDLIKSIIFSLYLLFTNHFINLKKLNKKTWRFLIILQCIEIVSGLFLSLTFFIIKDVELIRKLSIVYLIPIFNYLAFLVIILRQKLNYLDYWVILGGFLFFIGLISGGFLSLHNSTPFFRSYYQHTFHGIMGFNIMQMGIGLEMIIFLMAISLKNRDTQKTKDNLQFLNIKQLEENKKLQDEIKQLLEDKLGESEEKLKIEYTKTEHQSNEIELYKAQLQTLQLQMNPHYLFNSLNSVNDFIIKQEPREASEYLALYARMMRGILRNSTSIFNILEQELLFCEDYLQLESLRFEGRFQYFVKIERHINLTKYKIPGMMLQIVLENAVWHGIMPLKAKGKIILEIKTNEQGNLWILISDNGSGIDNVKMAEQKDSYGLRNIREKIAILKKIYKKEVVFEMQNLPQNSGLKVSFVFPKFEEI
jgi:sensor histidine kinase YesM